MTSVVQPIVLAGGAGTRLWPISTPAQPKHLLPLVGGDTLLEQTLARFSDSSRFSEPVIVCAATQADRVGTLAPNARLIVEPCARSSAAAMALAALAADPDAILLALPSDHHIGDPAPLLNAVGRALPIAQAGKLVTFGITPVRPESGYGYITAGDEIGRGIFEAKWFVEKPALELARRLIDSGESYWNAGIFLFKAEVLLDELERHAPDIAQASRKAMSAAREDGNRFYPAHEPLDSCPSISIDYAVMERSDRIAVVPVELDWSDIGNWDAIYQLARKNADGNVLDDRSRTLDSHGCLLRSEGPMVVAVGVSDLIIVATDTHVLVVPRSEAQRVREAADLAAGTPKTAQAADGQAGTDEVSQDLRRKPS